MWALAPLILLVPIGIGLFTLSAWLKAIVYLCEGRFIRSGIWLCTGVMLLNLFIGHGESFMPLYITIMVAAFGATIQKHTRKVQKIDWPEQSMLLDLHRDEWHEIN